ncbi:MAG TPA: metal ABC transporter permease [Tepidisphaeraceae bacterium]|nr:metal ABC transporter permease [Tepidisphaeraceae bacterium]
MHLAAANSILLNTLATATALAVACAVLSVVVVLRRWAFIGEGISHAGFGGAGTAWLLMLLFPGLDTPWAPYAFVVLFCLGTALAIGAMSREHGLHADAAIGIFLVASLAWGFLAQHVYTEYRHTVPTLFDVLLFGRIVSFSPEYTRVAVAICLAVILVVAALWKEILAYCFDPILAETSGVRSGLVHYLLMILVTMVIVVGVRVAGSVLVTALLVLPGATALLISHRLRTVMLLSLGASLTGMIAGLLINLRWPYLPAGPAMVLVMFAEFLIAWSLTRLPRRAGLLRSGGLWGRA